MAVVSLPRRRTRTRIDLGAVALVPAAILLVVLSQLMDGMSAGFLLHAPAALIVLGGTTAVVLVTYRRSELKRSMQAAARTFKVFEDDTDALAATLLSLSIRAHKRGLMALESEVEGVSDPFLKEGLQLVADSASIETIKEMLQVESAARESEDEAPARVFEAAAGYAPTLGILGAVLGLAQVMQKLSARGTVGGEIAVAFVATIYGVGLANLILLPVAGRIRERAGIATRRREMITHALCAMRAQMHPRLLAQRMRSYSTELPRIEDLAVRPSLATRRIPA